MKTSRLFLSLGLAAGLGATGCGMGGASMHDYAASLGEHAIALETAEAAHDAQLGRVVNLAQVPGIEDDHLTSMQGHMGQMQHMMTDMMMCMSGWDGRPDSMGFHADMLSMQQEWAAHHAAMGAARDLDAAKSEEKRHQSMMSSLFVPMRQHQASMMDSAGSFGCGMHDH